MYQRKLEKDIRCPLEYGMELFGGKWNSRIICVLATLEHSVMVKFVRKWEISPTPSWPPH